MWVLFPACAPTEPEPPPTFVRDGLWTPGGGLVERPWTPGERVGDAGAPLQAECVPLFSVPLAAPALPLGDGPDTALAFSPDGSRLAVGSAGGEVLVLDAWTGRELARRGLA